MLTQTISPADVWEMVQKALVWLAGIGIVVDLTPGIKIQPVRWVLKQLGNLLMQDTKKQLEEMQKDTKKQFDEMRQDIQGVKTDLQDHKVDSWRCEILDFANSCMNQRKHTKEEFDHVISTCDKYGSYIEDRHLTNGQVDVAEEYIKEIYKERMKHNDFLVVHAEDQKRGEED